MNAPTPNTKAELLSKVVEHVDIADATQHLVGEPRSSYR